MRIVRKGWIRSRDGRGTDFDGLKEYMTAERGAIPYDVIARTLNCSEGAARVDRTILSGVLIKLGSLSRDSLGVRVRRRIILEPRRLA